MNSNQPPETATVTVENVGGIAETSITLTPGITVLAGRNATNRTSLLQAILAALGSDNASLKRDADEGRVELIIDDETYTREFTKMVASPGVAILSSTTPRSPTYSGR